MFRLALWLLASDFVPPVYFRLIVRLAVAYLRRRQAREARRQVVAPPPQPAPAGALYLVDGYHGGVVFWDWLVLPEGGLWYVFNWPLCVQPAVERALQHDRLRVVLDLDGHTYEDMARKAPQAIRQLREAVRLGRLEIVNGTYAQPLAQSTSGESFVRQLFYGLETVRRVLGSQVTCFYSQEPAYFPQLPQVLREFGFRGVVFRSQWAAFGTDPAHDAPVVRWQGPDGSVIPAIPRYAFQQYDRLRAEHPGLPSMAMAAGDRADWELASLAAFECSARERGIPDPLVTDLKDPNLPDAPLPQASAIAAMENVRFVTPTEYFRRAGEQGPLVQYSLDDIPSTLPWGLQGEMMVRARVDAEDALLVAERLDAVAFRLGRRSEESSLEEGWKSLCLSQHHDLHVCGPWHSRRHGCSMADVAIEYAARSRQKAEEVREVVAAWLTERASGDVLVFNPSPWPRRDYVEVRIEKPGLSPTAVVLTDGEEEIPCQVVAAGDGTLTVGFVLELPSLGYRCLRWSARPSVPETGLSRNQWHKAEVHPDGSLSVEVNGRPGVTAGGELTVWRDGAWHSSRQAIRRVELVEDGPVYRRYQVEGKVAGVPFSQTFTLYRRLARIDGCVTLDFGDGTHLGPQMEDDRPGRAMAIQDEKKLCLAFRSSLRRTWCDSLFLVTETSGDRIVGLRWVGLEDGEGAGVALLNRGTPGYHVDRQGGLLRNVLAWGPREWIYASDDSIRRGRSRYTALRGRHRYHHAVFPYASRQDAQRAAMDFHLPCQSWCLPRSTSGPLETRSFLKVEPETVLVTAHYVHRGRAVLRLWNPSPRETLATVRVGDEERTEAVDMALQAKGPALPDGRIPLRPWGVQTVVVTQEGSGANSPRVEPIIGRAA